MAPAKWSPPEFLFYRHPDGSVVAVDPNGVPLPSQPQLQVSTTDGVTAVTDPWGNAITAYELPEFTVHLVTKDPFGMNPKTVAVAVDANGDPVPLLGQLEVTFDDPVKDVAGVVLPDGSKATVPQYEGTADFFVHIEASSQDLSRGTVTYEMVAVDADGVPLPVQPVLGGDPTDPSSIWAQWGTGTLSSPSVYQFPEFSVHLVSQGIPGMGAPKLAPVAVDANGVPLPTQPPMQLDPLDLTKVTATMPDGTSLEPRAYVFPEFSVYVHSTTPLGHGAPNYVAVAVDANGVPLSIQPYLEVDPTNPDKVTATFADLTTYEPTPYDLPKDFYVHVVASGPASGMGTQTFDAIAVDANGVRLPIQPYLEIDPLDPTKVTATFSDGSTYEPPNLYPPPGAPPEEWPPPATETTEPPLSEADDEDVDGDEAAVSEATDGAAGDSEVATALETAEETVAEPVGDTFAEPAAAAPGEGVGEAVTPREDLLVAGLVEPATETPPDRTPPPVPDEVMSPETVPPVDALVEEIDPNDLVGVEPAPTRLDADESELAAPAEPDLVELGPIDASLQPTEDVDVAEALSDEPLGDTAEVVEADTALDIQAVEADVVVAPPAPEVVVEPVATPVEAEPIPDDAGAAEAEEIWEDDA